MDLDKALVGVAKVLFGLPNASTLIARLQSGRQSPQDIFLKQKSISNEIYSNEPGCTVNYEAMYEKIHVMEPYLKATLSGPGLIAFFADLRKLRHAWTIDFANYAAHAILVRLPGTSGVTGSLGFSEQAKTLAHKLATKENKLKSFKESHNFARHVFILEECIKKHKVHLLRKAHADKSRVASVKKQRRGLGKRKKATTAASRKALQTKRAESKLSPDLPDFVQFMKDYSSNGTTTDLSTSQPGPSKGYATNAPCVEEQLNRPSLCVDIAVPDMKTRVDPAISGRNSDLFQAQDFAYFDPIGFANLIGEDQRVHNGEYDNQMTEVMLATSMNCEPCEVYQTDDTYGHPIFYPDLVDLADDNAVDIWGTEPQLSLSAMPEFCAGDSQTQTEADVIDPQLMCGDGQVFTARGEYTDQGQTDNTLPVWLDKEEEACFRQIFGSD